VQRTLARAGFGSRRSAEELIEAGRVRVNGRVAILGDRMRPGRDQLSVDGVAVPTDPDLTYLAMNKPAGVTTTVRDAHAERTVAELLPPGPRVVPVGRLDRESEGLLLFTNDGDLAHRLTHPRFGVEKEYLVEVGGRLPRSVSAGLVRGVELPDGPARALRVGPVVHAASRSAVSVVMAEGRKREVRRLFAALGFTVSRLVRVRIGPVLLGQLPPGGIRSLAPEEVMALYRVTGLERARVGAHRARPNP
jgi:23S rRNA pseudouridine2605 synthase